MIKKNKRLVAGMLILCMALGLVGCSNSPEESPKPSGDRVEEDTDTLDVTQSGCTGIIRARSGGDFSS